MAITTKTNLPLSEILKWHKGRVCRIPRENQSQRSSTSPSIGSDLFPTASYKSNKTSNLSARDKASGLVNKYPESIVKIDKASKGIKSHAHMMTAANYIARNGKIDLEDESGLLIQKDELKNRIAAWCESQNVPEIDSDTKRPADARRIIISCPKGTDPEAVKKAVRQLAKETFADDGFQYLFGMHNKSEAMPDEPDHPHVHILIKSVNSKGQRLNLRKEDLRYLRERFAVIAKEYGIDINATSRVQRGKLKKGKTQERIHQEYREFRANHITHPYSKERLTEINKALKEGADLHETEVKEKAKKTRNNVLKNAQKFVDELRKTGKEDDLKLASDLCRYMNNLPPLETSQEELLRKLKAYDRTQKAKGYDIKEKIRQRKSQHKQSQAQKWAIHRKKQNQER